MKHIRKVSATRAIRADAYAAFLNDIWQAWLNFLFAKKNQTLPGT